MSYVSVGNGHSSLKDDGTFAKDEQWEKRDDRNGKPLSMEEIKKRLKGKRRSCENSRAGQDNCLPSGPGGCSLVWSPPKETSVPPGLRSGGPSRRNF